MKYEHCKASVDSPSVTNLEGLEPESRPDPRISGQWFLTHFSSIFIQMVLLEMHV